jgi:hypothetical protein
MNVWIWGPPMWEILHASSAVLDEHKLSAKNLFKPLGLILPCSFCRNSFVDFYNQLGDPKVGLAFNWAYDVHNLVNMKLERQRIQKYMPNADEGMFNMLFNIPTLEVVRKRQLINSAEPISWSKLSTALIAVVMGMQLQDSPPLNEFKTFVETLRVVVSKQSSPLIDSALEGLLKILRHGLQKCKLYLEKLKYPNIQMAESLTAMIKAGACIAGTCK